MIPTTKRAIFIDRDGVLNAMVYDDTHGLLDSPRQPDDVRMMRGAGQFIAHAKERGWLVIVITNQPGIAKGYFTIPELETVNATLREQLIAEAGTAWDDLLYCPHHPAGTQGKRNQFVTSCTCRKPAPGLLLDAARRHDIDLTRSWMIGDGLVDIQAGRRAGCRTMLVAGNLKIETITRFVSMDDAHPDAVINHLSEALPLIEQPAHEKN